MREVRSMGAPEGKFDRKSQFWRKGLEKVYGIAYDKRPREACDPLSITPHFGLNFLSFIHKNANIYVDKQLIKLSTRFSCSNETGRH